MTVYCDDCRRLTGGRCPVHSTVTILDSVTVGPVPVQPLDYRPITATLQLLPRSRRWTRDERQRWLAMMTAVIDLMVEEVP